MTAVKPSVEHEKTWWQMGKFRVAGIDEVGRGPLAGPVVAAAVIVTPESDLVAIDGANDSKKLTASQRERLASIIRASFEFGIGQSSVSEIDELGIAVACRLAMRRAIWALPNQPDALLLDAFPLKASALPQHAIVRGDALCISIAAASIVAKVERDALLAEADCRYPAYGFRSHKGYGSSSHLAALETHGPCPLHRRSFAPLRLRLT